MNGVFIIGILLFIPTVALAETPTIVSNGGQIEYHSRDGEITVLPISGDFSSPTLSPDGRSVTYVHVVKPETQDRDGEAELWIADGPTGHSHRLMDSRPSPDPKRNLQWFDGPIFSVDGRSIFVTSLAWGDEMAVHRVDIATGKERFVTDGSLDAVIRSGPYSGYLLLRRHTPWPAPRMGFHYPAYVVSTDDKTSFRVPGMDGDDDRIHVDNWLTTNAWTAW